MTEQMAIRELEDCIELPFGVSISDETCKMAIQSLEEIRQYRAIGTVEELQALKEKSVAKKPLLRLCGDCQRGCVDCDRYEDRCPNCNGGLYVESGKPHEHCPHCGQKLDWE